MTIMVLALSWSIQNVVHDQHLVKATAIYIYQKRILQQDPTLDPRPMIGVVHLFPSLAESEPHTMLPKCNL